MDIGLVIALVLLAYLMYRDEQDYYKSQTPIELDSQ